MRTSEKDFLVAEVAERHVGFEMAFSDKRKHPVREFRAFWEAGLRYAELTKRDPLTHRSVVSAVKGLKDFVTAGRRRVPEQVVRDAERLESLLFSEYDPYFEGDESDEPPGR
jgi:hypothetical protein